MLLCSIGRAVLRPLRRVGDNAHYRCCITIFHCRIYNYLSFVLKSSQFPEGYVPLFSTAHPFTFTVPHPTVQRAACALHFKESLQESTEIIQLINHLPALFNLSHLLEGYIPRFSLPKLPPHFAKCGGNQQNENLPYFLLFHLHTHKERGRCLAICAFFRCNYSFNPAVFSRRKRKLKIGL